MKNFSEWITLHDGGKRIFINPAFVSHCLYWCGEDSPEPGESVLEIFCGNVAPPIPSLKLKGEKADRLWAIFADSSISIK